MLFPRQIARFWVLWTHAFSATVSRPSLYLSWNFRVLFATFSSPPPRARCTFFSLFIHPNPVLFFSALLEHRSTRGFR
jgi:hypothetical protein